MRKAISFKIISPETILSTFESVYLQVLKGKRKIILSSQTKIDLKTAFVEAVANAQKHAGELKKRGAIEGRFFLDDKTIGFEVYDHGKGFDVELVEIPDLSDFKSSGRGIFMMKQLGDILEYKKSGTKNTLVFKRHLVGQSESSRELDLLYELSEAIIQNTTLDEIYQIVLERALELFHVERASILIYDEKLRALKVVASRGMSESVLENIRVRAGEGVSGYVYQHGRPLLIEDMERNKRGLEKKEHYKTRSFISAPMICSPLRFEEKPIGVINLTDRIDGKKFTKKDLKLLSTIANQAMACVHIRGLVDEIKKTEGLKQEMEQVRLIQSSYLPKKPPRVSGYDLGGRCEMAQSVGGDYFDYYHIGENLFVVVADVSGHNTSSAVTMVNFRSQLKVFLSQHENPAWILTQLNRSLYADLHQFEQFVSCLLIRFDVRSGSYEMANAGHYPPLTFPDRVLPLESGIVMGITEDEIYHNQNGDLRPHEGMLFFTDGVIESMDNNGKVFGIDQLKKDFSSKAHLSSQDLVDHVIHSVMNVRGDKRVLDDITVVAVKRNE